MNFCGYEMPTVHGRCYDTAEYTVRNNRTVVVSIGPTQSYIRMNQRQCPPCGVGREWRQARIPLIPPP
jgi:hypothetical protein